MMIDIKGSNSNQSGMQRRTASASMAWTLPHSHSSKDRRGVFVAYHRRLKQILQAYALPLPSRTMSGLSLLVLLEVRTTLVEEAGLLALAKSSAQSLSRLT
jgi:hypothetical protein